jgi:hypothetical protein
MVSELRSRYLGRQKHEFHSAAFFFDDDRRLKSFMWQQRMPRALPLSLATEFGSGRCYCGQGWPVGLMLRLINKVTLSWVVFR